MARDHLPVFIVLIPKYSIVPVKRIYKFLCTMASLIIPNTFVMDSAKAESEQNEKLGNLNFEPGFCVVCLCLIWGHFGQKVDGTILLLNQMRMRIPTYL